MSTPGQLRRAARRRSAGIGGLVVAVLVAILLAWRFLGLSGSAATAAEAFVVGATATAWSTARLSRHRRALPSPFARVAEPLPAPSLERPGELVRLERIVTASLASAREVHLGLRPLLMGIATVGPPRRPAGSAPAGTVGTGEDRVPDGMVGGALHEVLRDDRPRPERASEPGLDLATLARIVAELEEGQW